MSDIEETPPNVQLHDNANVSGGRSSRVPSGRGRQRSEAWLTPLRTTHPRTVAAFEDMDALPQLRAVVALDERWAALERGVVGATLHEVVDELPLCDGEWDMIYAGGGLGLIHALVMQRRGYRVLVFDRDRVGRAHREWNISDAELQALVDLGVFDQHDLAEIVAHRHERGVVRFHSANIDVPPAEIWMTGVLDVSLDAAALLQSVRRKFEAAGGTVLDHQTLRAVRATPDAVAIHIQAADGDTRWLRARLLLDAMGATSPLALQRHRGQPFAGVCPTVGSIVSGLEPGSESGQHDSRVGDILISVADVQQGQQLIWEGFAGRDDQLTVYVFYYDRVGARFGTHSLLDLFEQYFALLPTYKRPGPRFRHQKPVYGFIPARHTERRSTAPLLQGVLPVGDAAAQQSPLTFTGFGSHVRNLARTTALLDYALRWDLLEPRWLEHITAYQANVALHWVLSRFMHPWGAPNTVNQLQNVFARVLNDLGSPLAERFFKDRMRWSDYGRILNHTLRVYRPIIPTALAVLGPRDTLRWIVDYLRFTRAAAAAALGRGLGRHGWFALERIVEGLNPGWSLVLRGRRAEWRAMGWIDDMLE